MAALAKRKSIDEQATATQRKLSVLYAEDQTSARVVTTALLRKLGYAVDAVEDGELALQKAVSTSYDIILLDIEMPVMDGVTAARRIRTESELCQHVPILALSAYLADTTEDNGWRSLFDFALPKPATGSELEAALAKALAAHRNATDQLGSSDEFHSIQNLTFHDFRNALPWVMWVRLVERAAEDMHNLALTAIACSEARDAIGFKQSIKGLETLAASFQADQVLAAAHMLEPAAQDIASSALVSAIDAWSRYAAKG
jgi:CheY-like chemotaxis protein